MNANDKERIRQAVMMFFVTSLVEIFVRIVLVIAAIIVLLVVYLPSAQAADCQFKTECNFIDPWTDADTARQVAFAALVYVDYRQTISDLDNPNHYETNRVLGKYPTKEEVQRYMLGATLLHTGIAYVLPAEARKWWQYVWIGVEANVVYSNYKLGVRIDW